MTEVFDSVRRPARKAIGWSIIGDVPFVGLPHRVPAMRKCLAAHPEGGREAIETGPGDAA